MFNQFKIVMKVFVTLFFTLLFFNLASDAQNVGINRISKIAPTNLADFSGEQYFLKIDGINGSSTEANHTNWIEIESFEFGISKPMVNNQASGKPAYEFSLTKRTDVSSLDIIASISNNTGFSQAVLDVTQTIKNKTVTVLKFTFSNVVFSKYEVDADAKGMVEEIELKQQKLVITYYSYDVDGNLVKTVQKEIMSNDNA